MLLIAPACATDRASSSAAAGGIEISATVGSGSGVPAVVVSVGAVSVGAGCTVPALVARPQPLTTSVTPTAIQTRTPRRGLILNTRLMGGSYGGEPGDRAGSRPYQPAGHPVAGALRGWRHECGRKAAGPRARPSGCLLYTSDAADELARSVAQAGAIRSTVTSPASGGREYVARGQCRSESAVGGYSYSVTVDGAAFSSADLPCDGSVTVNSLGPVKEKAVVAIALLPPGGTSPGTAYVVVLPAS